MTEHTLGIWSWNLPEFITPLKSYHRGSAHGETMAKLFKCAKIVLNIHREFEVGGGNFRLFEIAACGAFQLVDEKQDIGKYFEIGKEIVTFSDEHDLRKKVSYYLDHPAERATIAEAGFRRAKKDHTLLQRMQSILDIERRTLPCQK